MQNETPTHTATVRHSDLDDGDLQEVPLEDMAHDIENQAGTDAQVPTNKNSIQDEIDIDEFLETYTPETASTEDAESQRSSHKLHNKFPDCFYCPVTGEVMLDPMVRPDGQSYDRSALAGIVPRGHPNRALKACIEQEVQRQEQVGSIRGSVRAWNESLRSRLQKLANNYRPLPDAFYCPITLDLIYDPVIDPEGNSYEREAILKWIEAHGTSPVTRTKLSVTQLYDNMLFTAQLLWISFMTLSLIQRATLMKERQSSNGLRHMAPVL